MLTFIKEYSYANYFRIPIQLIKLDINNVLFTFLELSFILVPLLGITHSLNQLFSPKDLKDPLGRRLHQLVKFIILLTAIILLFKNPFEKSYIVYLVVFFFYIFIKFILPLITERGTEGYKHKLLNNERNIGNSYSNNLSQMFMEKIGVYTIKTIIIITLLGAVLQYQGGIEAIDKKDFYILNDDKNRLVLRIYGDNIISAEFNAKTQEIYDDFSIHEINNGTDTKLTKVHFEKIKKGDK